MVFEAEKENGGLLAVHLFLLMLFLQLALRFLAPLIAPTKKRVSAKESELVSEIKQLYRDADALSMPATFAKSSKLRRAAVAKEKELALLKSSSGFDYSWVARQLSLSLLLKGIIIVGLGGWFRHTSVASVPATLLQPFEHFSSENNDMAISCGSIVLFVVNIWAAQTWWNAGKNRISTR